MRRLAPRAVLLFLLTFGVVLMHQVPMPMSSAGHTASGQAGDARAVTAQQHRSGTAAPGHDRADGAAPQHSPVPAERPSAVTAHAEHGQQQGDDHGADHCGWMLHLCLAILLTAFGLLTGPRRLIRTKPVRPPRYRNPPPRSVRTRPPTPDLYALRVLRL